jgi:hypothetical protein
LRIVASCCSIVTRCAAMIWSLSGDSSSLRRNAASPFDANNRSSSVCGVVFAYDLRRPMAIVRPGDDVCGAGCASGGAIIVIGRFSEVTWPWKGTSPGSPLEELDANIWSLSGKTETILARNRRFESSSLHRGVSDEPGARAYVARSSAWRARCLLRESRRAGRGSTAPGYRRRRSEPARCRCRPSWYFPPDGRLGQRRIGQLPRLRFDLDTGKRWARIINCRLVGALQ